MAMFERSSFVSSGNVRLTTKLFYETVGEDKSTALFTLKSDNHEGYPSLRKLYVKYCVEDPTEVEFCQAVFGDWDIWEKLSSAEWFLNGHLTEWRKETDIKRKHLAFKSIIRDAKSGDRNSYQAAKFLIEEPWKKGRVARADVRKTTDEAAQQLSADIARIKDYR